MTTIRVARSPKIDDPKTERALSDHADAIGKVAAHPVMSTRVIPDVVLEDGVPTQVAHGLGRAPVWVRESCPRGAVTTGRIDELRTAPSRTTHVVLVASGWGAAITVDVEVR